MRDIDVVAMARITTPIKELNHHIECLQNDTEYVDNGEYISDLDREAYADELIRDRELWLDDLKRNFSHEVVATVDIGSHETDVAWGY
jgi:hypothetical protein